MFKNYALYGSENQNDAAIYNKTFAYLDDLESLLYSPVSLRFHIGDPDLPNILEEAKGRTASGRLRSMARRSDTDTSISEAVFWALVKGKTFVKQKWGRGGFIPTLIQPEMMGVYRETHDKLDEDMEAFVHTMLITPFQLERILWSHPDRKELAAKAKRQMQIGEKEPESSMQIVTGGLYPFSAQGTNQPGQPLMKGIVDWLGSPVAELSPNVKTELVRLDELWVWDDRRSDWATFQIVGDDCLIFGGQAIVNALHFNPDTGMEDSDSPLKGKHPFTEFCPNRIDGYFWGRSEILSVALLQECINSRLAGINKLLRLQEDPPKKFTGVAGVNQAIYSRLNKPGGRWSDASPNAKVEDMPPQISADMWNSLHEYERMFDEMGGLPPIAKGHGEAGVRSQGHAETLVRMFTPRFKDRALLVERDVEGLGALMLDMERIYDPKQLFAWVSKDQAGLEAPVDDNPFLIPPAEGMVPVKFRMADLDEDVSLTIDAHSSSPAFAADAKALTFDLLKVGVYGQEDVADHVDITDPAQTDAGIKRRAVAKAKAEQEALQQEQLTGHRSKRK